MIFEKTNEKNLGEMLNLLFPNLAIKPQYSFKNSEDRKFRVDYALFESEESERPKYIFEFDGPTHYTQEKVIIRDRDLEKYCDLNMIRLIRVPYFMQFNEEFFNVYWVDSRDFDETPFPYSVQYKHGFYDRKIVYPIDYNASGVQRFIRELRFLRDISNDSEYMLDSIMDSLRLNINEHNKTLIISDAVIDAIEEPIEDFYEYLE